MLTPQFKTEKLSQTLGAEFDIYIKREDEHPLKSHKGRSLPLMIEKCFSEGHKKFVISSSGNAALAASIYINEHNKKNPENILTLEIYLGEHIENDKLDALKKIANGKEINLNRVEKPKQTAHLAEKTGKYKNLRQSTDDTALLGYSDLARELYEIKDLSAIFIPTSSGTTAQGIFEAFKKTDSLPEIHIVQTENCHPLVNALEGKTYSKKTLSQESLAKAIVDQIGHRKEGVAEAVKTSGGNGWIVNNEEISKTIKIIKETTQLDVSPNSALSVAGLIKAIESGKKFNGPVVCIFTGR